MKSTVRKIFIMLSILLIAGTMLLNAQAEEHGRMSDTIINEIKRNQKVDSIGQINPDKVSTELLEELGDAIMVLMIADEEQHAVMDRMMGGEGSEQLSSTHRWLGFNYLQNEGNDGLPQLGLWLPIHDILA